MSFFGTRKKCFSCTCGGRLTWHTPLRNNKLHIRGTHMESPHWPEHAVFMLATFEFRALFLNNWLQSQQPQPQLQALTLYRHWHCTCIHTVQALTIIVTTTATYLSTQDLVCAHHWRLPSSTLIVLVADLLFPSRHCLCCALLGVFCTGWVVTHQ